MRMMRKICCALCCLVLGQSQVLPAMAAGTGAAHMSGCCLSLIYGVVAVLSLLLLLAYVFMFRRKEPWFVVLFASVLVANCGYFLLSVSDTLGEAMLANRIAYLGSACLPLCMLMIIIGLCDLHPRKSVVAVLITVSSLVFLLAASGGYLPLYYKEVFLETVNGAAKLRKVYGPLHSVYFIYLLSYLAAMVGVITYAAVKKKGRYRKYAPVMCTVVLLNLAIWFVEQQINWEFELLSVSDRSELLLKLGNTVL